MGDAVCLVQIPFWAPLAERLRERLGWRVVYDCMDEWTNFPGFGESVLSLEEKLVRGADATIVSADRLEEKWKDTAPRLVLARNAMDAEHYRARYAPNELLGKVRHPVIGYYGALASWVDVPLLTKIAEAHPDATIVLAGGQFDVDLTPDLLAAERAPARPAALRRDAAAALELRRLHHSVPRQRHHRGDQPRQVLRVPLRRQAGRRAGADGAAPVRRACRTSRAGTTSSSRSSSGRSPSPRTIRAAAPAARSPRRTTGRTATRRSTTG